MRHTMNLDPAPFEMIASGRKKIELRLNDEKRRKINPGDEILFTNNVTGQTLLTQVKGIERFPDFKALYCALPLLECGYTEETVASASYRDYALGRDIKTAGKILPLFFSSLNRSLP